MPQSTYAPMPLQFLLSYVMSCHVLSCHVMSCHVMSCNVFSVFTNIRVTSHEPSVLFAGHNIEPFTFLPIKAILLSVPFTIFCFYAILILLNEVHAIGLLYHAVPKNLSSLTRVHLSSVIILRCMLRVYVIVLCCAVLNCTVLYCTVLYCTVLYCTVLYCTVLYCTVLYCTVLYCTVLY